MTEFLAMISVTRDNVQRANPPTLTPHTPLVWNRSGSAAAEAKSEALTESNLTASMEPSLACARCYKRLPRSAFPAARTPPSPHRYTVQGAQACVHLFCHVAHSGSTRERN